MLPIKIKDRGGYRHFMFSNDGVWFHLGHDFNVPENTEIYSIADGEIIFSGMLAGFGGTDGRYGGCIIIQHDGYIGVYGHLKKMLPIKTVKEGDLIGLVAPYYMGNLRVDHLHFGKHLGNGWPMVTRNDKTEKSYLGYEHEGNLSGWVDPLGGEI